MRIVWSAPAVADLEAIYDYIARDSPHYASRFVQRLISATEPLESFPNFGRVVGNRRWKQPRGGRGLHRSAALRRYFRPSGVAAA
jgi:plasmid stabilization system protein ParE